MELHTLPQGKGVCGLILRDLVMVSDRGHQVSVRRGLHQALKYVEHDFLGSCRHRQVRVKTLVQVLRDAHHDLIRLGPRSGRAVRCLSVLCCLLCAAASASGECGAQEARQKKECQ